LANLLYHNPQTNQWEILNAGGITDKEETNKFDVDRLQTNEDDLNNIKALVSGDTFKIGGMLLRYNPQTSSLEFASNEES
jgi:hypothetical protein